MLVCTNYVMACVLSIGFIFLVKLHGKFSEFELQTSSKVHGSNQQNFPA